MACGVFLSGRCLCWCFVFFCFVDICGGDCVFLLVTYSYTSLMLLFTAVFFATPLAPGAIMGSNPMPRTAGTIMVSKTCFKVHKEAALTQTLTDSQWDITGIIANLSLNPTLLNQMADMSDFFLTTKSTVIVKLMRTRPNVSRASPQSDDGWPMLSIIVSG